MPDTTEAPTTEAASPEAPATTNTVAPALSDERRHLLFDIFITALEGGIGYWVCRVNRYHHHTTATSLSDAIDDGAYLDGCDLDGFYALVEDEGDTYRIDRAVIVKGLGLIVSGDIQINRDLRDTIIMACADNDGGDIDAEAADCIVQCGLFGEIVYG